MLSVLRKSTNGNRRAFRGVFGTIADQINEYLLNLEIIYRHQRKISRDIHFYFVIFGLRPASARRRFEQYQPDEFQLRSGFNAPASMRDILSKFPTSWFR